MVGEELLVNKFTLGDARTIVIYGANIKHFLCLGGVSYSSGRRAGQQASGGGDGHNPDRGTEGLQEIQVQEQIILVLQRLREDMQSVMERLEVVEGLAAANVSLYGCVQNSRNALTGARQIKHDDQTIIYLPQLKAVCCLLSMTLCGSSLKHWGKRLKRCTVKSTSLRVLLTWLDVEGSVRSTKGLVTAILSYIRQYLDYCLPVCLLYCS